MAANINKMGVFTASVEENDTKFNKASIYKETKVVNPNLVSGMYQCTSSNSAFNQSGGITINLSAADLYNNRGKTLTVSYQVYSVGAGQSTVSDYRAGRFGIHCSLYYANTAGGNTQTYPFADALGYGHGEQTVVMSWTIPTDIAPNNTQVIWPAIQTDPSAGFAKPASSNPVTWFIKNYKMEWGSIATPYCPHVSEMGETPPPMNDYVTTPEIWEF